MLIKQKLKLYEKQKGVGGDFTNQVSTEKKQSSERTEKNNGEFNQKMNKVNWMMEQYIWKYVDKLDDKLEDTADKIMKQVDKYVIGQIPEKFELEDDNEDELNESPAKLNANEHYKPLD